MDINKRFALIVAGGSGARMKSALPSNFMTMNGITCVDAYQSNGFLRMTPSIEIDCWWLPLISSTFGLLCESMVYGFDASPCVQGQCPFESVKHGLAANR
jgi:hypothetical protein